MDPNVIEKFLQYTEKTDTCWYWCGRLSTSDKPVPFFQHDKKKYNAKVLSLQIAGKPSPTSKHTMFSYCNNNLCVNPEHLYWTNQDRFWTKVDKSGECWIWTGGLHSWGYGKFSVRIDGKEVTLGAHTYAYELEHGPIPEGMIVCHSCDNPPCIRASHLFLGTQADNIICLSF